MSSEERAERAYVWTWLPEATEPVVAGRVATVGDLLTFNYGQSYLAREDAVPLYLPELPLREGRIDPPGNLTAPGVIDDAGPDAWGQRVVMRHVIGEAADRADPAELSRLTYLLESGSDRIGALDFQASPDTYVSRNGGTATLEELFEAAERLMQGLPLTPDLDRALLHGSSVGGARPKALLSDGQRKLIAKFSSSTDTYPVVKGEFIAMELARRAGLDAARVEYCQVLGRDVLLVERFDREATAAGVRRRAIVSALTILELDAEREARYATYYDLAQIIRARFTRAKDTLRELFARITFNILVGNIDDHARNHAAFWDGRAKTLTLTPAYDVCPQPRSGLTASQSMAFAPGGRESQLELAIRASATYLLSEAQAREIVDRQIETISGEWDAVTDAAKLNPQDRSFFKGRQFLNPYAFEGYSSPSPW
ncbi:MAG TPA: HipA domain-containing protein [Solirubrobacterales bacterium]|nr:HipA domain-containing protein [Solirubrobacterales bacterium]